MSRSTDVVLLQKYLGNWEAERLPTINKYFDATWGAGLVSVQDESFHDERGVFRRWYGGTRLLGASIAIGAFRGLDIEEFIAFLKSEVPWGPTDGTCQLLVLDEEAQRFKLFDIYDSW